MRAGTTHEWPTSVADARLVQQQLRHRVIATGSLAEPRWIAGVDIHVAPATGLTWGAIALLEMPGLELVESVLAAVPTSFPYVPGYLSFREIPAALEALALLEHAPALLRGGGQGTAPPRRLGIAAHLGVLTDFPAIGVARPGLFGKHDPPPLARGGRVP